MTFKTGDRVRFNEKSFVLYHEKLGTIVDVTNDKFYPYDVEIDAYPGEPYPTATKEIDHAPDEH